jgi:Rieske Fe-S protein
MSLDLSRRELLALSVVTSACASDPTSAMRSSDRPDPDVATAAPDVVDAAAAPDVVDATAAPDVVDAAAAPDVVDATAAPDVVDAAAPRDVSDVPAAQDVTDVPGVDAGPPCGLEDPFRASVLLSAVPSPGGVVDLGINVVVARDARGLYAFSAVCPHEGCVVQITRGASTTCPCHDSTFDDDGAWTGGPARRPLLNHPVQVCEGRVYVDRSLGVPLGTRTPV